MITIQRESINVAPSIHKEMWKHYNTRVTYQVSEKMKSKDICCLITARENKECIGFSIGYIDINGDKVGATVVKEDHRGEGIATKLIKFRNSIFSNIISKVWEENSASIKACKKAGLCLVETKTEHNKIIHFYK